MMKKEAANNHREDFFRAGLDLGDVEAPRNKLERELQRYRDELALHDSQLTLAQKQLRKSRDEYQRLYDSAPVGYVLLDENAKILKLNQAASKLLLEKKTGVSILPAISSDTRNRLLRFLSAVFFKKTDSAQGVEVVTIRDNRQLLIQGVKFNEKPSVALLSLTDISEHKRVRESLRQIEWLLTKTGPARNDYSRFSDNDCSELSRAVGPELMESVLSGQLVLLDTLCGICDRNGNRILELVSSEWCLGLRGHGEGGQGICADFLAQLAGAVSKCNQGKEAACPGGLRVFAEPVQAQGETIAVMYLAFGAPSEEPGELTRVGCRYGMKLNEVSVRAWDYEVRPKFLNDVARRKLKDGARVIEIMVERYRVDRQRGFLFEQVKNERRALAESEQRYRIMGETVSFGVWRSDAQGRMEYFSPAFLSLLDMKINEAYGMGWTRRLIPQEGERVIREWMRSVRAGEQFECEFSVPDRFSREHSILCRGTPVRNEEGIITCWVGINLDITDRKKAERVSRESQRRLNVFLGNLPGMAYRCRNDDRRTLEFASRGVRDLCGHDFDRLVKNAGLSFMDIIHPEDRQGVMGSIKRAVEQNSSFQYEYRIITVEGTKKWVLDRGMPVQDGRRTIIEGFITDITERKQAEEVLRRDNETFEQIITERTKKLVEAQVALEKSRRLSDIGMLSATVAHELRNPLGVIRTSVYNIQRKNGDPKLIRHLHNIEKKIIESNQIINNLLNYARLKTPCLEKVCLSKTLEECLKDTLMRFQEKRFNMSKDFSLIRNCRINVDPFQLKEMFCNILNNAIQAIPEDGEVSVTGKLFAGEVAVTVSDNGPGMNEEDLKRVFEPFFTRRSKGTGLGLTICREIAGLHGGQIEVASNPGKGTNVQVVLPLAGIGSGS